MCDGSDEDTHCAVGRSGPPITALNPFLLPSPTRRKIIIFKKVFILVFLVALTFLLKL